MANSSATAAAYPDRAFDQDGELITAGTGSAFTVKTARRILGNYRGLRICAQMHTVNTGACTLQVDDAPAAPVITPGGGGAPAGSLVAGGFYDFIYDDTAGGWQFRGYATRTRGGIVEITNGSFSGSTVDITDIPGDFSSLMLVLNGVSFDTAARAFRLLASDNNGASYDTSSTYFGAYIRDGVSLGGIGVATLVEPGNNTLVGDALSSTVTLKGYQTPGSRMSEFVSFTSGGGTRFGWAQWYGGSGQPLNALRMGLSGSGSFDAGSYNLYGIY